MWAQIEQKIEILLEENGQGSVALFAFSIKHNFRIKVKILTFPIIIEKLSAKQMKFTGHEKRLKLSSKIFGMSISGNTTPTMLLKSNLCLVGN